MQERNNWYRLQRALEIVLMTGQPTGASAAAATPSTSTYDFRAFFLHRPRLEVFRRIDERVEHMVRLACGMQQCTVCLWAASRGNGNGCK